VPVLKLLKSYCDTVSCLMDNLYYLGRIGFYRWSNPQEDFLVSAVGTFTTLTSLTLDILSEVLTIYSKKMAE
jgi:hypothetical protein